FRVASATSICIGESGHVRYRHTDAGWSSSVARRAHNPEVAGSNPVPATKMKGPASAGPFAFLGYRPKRVALGSVAVPSWSALLALFGSRVLPQQTRAYPPLGPGCGASVRPHRLGTDLAFTRFGGFVRTRQVDRRATRWVSTTRRDSVIST